MRYDSQYLFDDTIFLQFLFLIKLGLREIINEKSAFIIFQTKCCTFICKNEMSKNKTTFKCQNKSQIIHIKVFFFYKYKALSVLFITNWRQPLHFNHNSNKDYAA